MCLHRSKTRFGFLRKVVKSLTSEEVMLDAALLLLDYVLCTMSPQACANAVFAALERNPDPKFWNFQ